MNRRDLLSRVGLVAVAAGGALVGRLTADGADIGAAAGSPDDDPDRDDCPGADDAGRTPKTESNATDPETDDVDGPEAYGIDEDDLEAYGIDDPATVSEYVALGDIDDVDPTALIVYNDGDGEREVALTVALADGSDELDRTLDLPAERATLVLVGSRAGYEVGVETDGSTARTSIGRFEGGTARTTITVGDGGVGIETVSRG